jgi:plexin A
MASFTSRSAHRSRWHLLPLCLCWTLLLCIVPNALNATETGSSFASHSMLSYRTQNTSVNFTHVAYDSTGDRLYVGAANHLLQLDASHLSLQATARTGPLMDSLLCSPGECASDAYHLVSTVNTNKLLLPDPANNRLLACGSAQQGACRFHSLSNVTDAQALVPIPVAANDEHSSTLALLANSPLSGSADTSSAGNVLYVATTNSRLGPYRDMIPAICARSLESGPKQLNVIEADISDNARLDIDYHLRDYFLVNYVHAFSVGPFVYFASTQPRSHSRALEELGFGSRLARVCTADPAFRSYAEMSLQCLGADRRPYPLLQAATVIPAGSAFGRKWSFASDERLLIGLFARSKEHTNRPALGGALCIFPYSEINSLFNENVERCFNGSVTSRNMHYIANSIEDCPNNNNNGVSRLSIACHRSFPLVPFI